MGEFMDFATRPVRGGSGRGMAAARSVRAVPAAACAVAVALTAAGCGPSGGEGGSRDGSGRKSADSRTRSLPVETTPRSVTWTGTGEHAEHPLRVAPKLARGAPSDMKHVKLDDDLKGEVPYYLTVSYTNTGKKTLDDPSPENDFSVTDTRGGEGHSVMTFGGWGSSGSDLPSGCRAQGPDKLKAGGEAKACRIVMLPQGRQPAAISYADDDADPQTTPYVWKVGGHRDTAGPALGAHESGDSAWQNAGRPSTRVSVTPKSVRKGRIFDLSRFELDEDQKRLVPYYVSVEYHNRGGQKLYPDMQDGVRLGTDTGRRFDKLDLLDVSGQDPVPSCPEAKPDKMVLPRASVTQCSVHLLPKGDKPATVSFSGKGKGARDLTWHAE